MATLSHDDTLEDGAWKDSFDKLLDPIPVLRELNILKKNVRASFNINSSVENSSRDESDLPVSAPQFLAVPRNKLIEDIVGTKRPTSISTPIRQFGQLPFKCSLSPIYFGILGYPDKSQQGKDDKTNTAQFHATPINSEIDVPVYEDESSSFPSRMANLEDLPSLKISFKKFKKNKNARSQRHVFFNTKVETTPVNLKEQRGSCNEEIRQSLKRLTSIALNPGKWRKSLNVWRRTNQLHMPTDNLRDPNQCQLSHLVDSVEFVASTVIAGKRKSICLKSERVSENCIQTSGATEWETRVLQQCKQRTPLPFVEVFPEEMMQNCRKIGEGAYGEVFMRSLKSKHGDEDTVLKIIPIEGSIEINGEVQKSFEQILPEIIISTELCSLRDTMRGQNRTSGFVGIKKAACVRGKYPSFLIKLWKDYDEIKGSENDSPEVFTDSQLYIVLELSFGGKDLEAFVFNNSEQAYYALQQIVLTLAVAEDAFQFEHRDLHWGNILISQTNDKHIHFMLKDKPMTIPTKGVKITIIDYTLSRMNHNDCCLYNDLSSDEELFAASGDYQFDIYRMMRDLLKNNWETFDPKTNVFWISYVIAKIRDGVSYKNTKTKTHATFIKKLNKLQEIVLDFDSAVDFAKYLRKKT